MDLGTTQNQQPTGGEILLFMCTAWQLHVSLPHRKCKCSRWCMAAAPKACSSKPHASWHLCRPSYCTSTHTHTHSCACRWGSTYVCCMMSAPCLCVFVFHVLTWMGKYVIRWVIQTWFGVFFRHHNNAHFCVCIHDCLYVSTYASYIGVSCHCGNI